VHARYRCVDAAVRNGALKRGLGVENGPGHSARELSHVAAEQYERRATGLLLAAKRSRKLALGTEAVRTSIGARTIQLMLVGRDAEGDREELVAAAERLGRSCLVWKNREELGRLFGRALLSIVGVLGKDAGIATELRHVVRCATELAEDA
jgi:ribosomal protein L7Ae-like RNA K-turn-binding protein